MKKSVTMNLLAIGVVPILLFLALLFIYVLPVLESEKYGEKEIQAREMVNTALGIVENYYSQVQRGEISKTQAQRRAEDAIGAMTFGEGRQDYF